MTTMVVEGKLLEEHSQDRLLSSKLLDESAMCMRSEEIEHTAQLDYPTLVRPRSSRSPQNTELERVDVSSVSQPSLLQ